MKFSLSLLFFSLFAVSMFVGCSEKQKMREEGESAEVNQETEQAAKPDFGSATP